MSAKKRSAPGRDPLALMDEWFPPDAEDLALREAARARLRVAQAISTLRREAGVTQAELAQRIGTQRSAIGRLENPNYHGHSLPMLQKVASAFGKQVVVSFVDPDEAERMAHAARQRKHSTVRRKRRKGELEPA